MSRRPDSSSVVQPKRRPSVQSGGSMTPDVWTDTADGCAIEATDNPHHIDGYQLVTVLDAPHDLKALLYRRVPKQQTSDEILMGLQPWLQDELPAGLEDLAERAQQLTPAAQEALAHLTAAQRSALGL